MNGSSSKLALAGRYMEVKERLHKKLKELDWRPVLLHTHDYVIPYVL